MKSQVYPGGTYVVTENQRFMAASLEVLEGVRAERRLPTGRFVDEIWGTADVDLAGTTWILDPAAPGEITRGVSTRLTAAAEKIGQRVTGVFSDRYRIYGYASDSVTRTAERLQNLFASMRS